MIRLSPDRNKIREGDYEVGMILPCEFNTDVPHFDGEILQPACTCATVLICHSVGRQDKLWENISLDRELEESGIYRYLTEHDLTLHGHIFGMTLFDETDGDRFVHYIKYYLPVSQGQE